MDLDRTYGTLGYERCEDGAVENKGVPRPEWGNQRNILTIIIWLTGQIREMCQTVPQIVSFVVVLGVVSSNLSTSPDELVYT